MAAIIKAKKAAEKRAEWEAASKLSAKELDGRREGAPTIGAAGRRAPVRPRPPTFGRGGAIAAIEASVGRPTSRDVRAQDDPSLETRRTIEYGDTTSDDDDSDTSDADSASDDEDSDSKLGAAAPRGQ